MIAKFVTGGCSAGPPQGEEHLVDLATLNPKPCGAKSTSKSTSAPVHQNEVDEASAVASSVTKLKISRLHRLRVFQWVVL